MNEHVVVGVDFGSSRIKAAAYQPGGEMVALETIDTPVHHGSDGDDFPTLDLLAAAHDVVAALRAGPIAGVGMTSMGEVGAVVSDAGLAPVNFPAWYDDRGADIIDHLEQRWGSAYLRDATGRHCRTTSTVAKLGHLQAHDRTVPAGTFVGLCGALAYQLTGHTWQEAGLAATSGVYDLIHERYLMDLWQAAGLGHVTLAPVRPPGFSAPAVGPFASLLGMEPGAAVVIAGHDHPVASVGAGVRSGDVSDSMGTGEAIIASLPREPAVTQAQLATFLDRDPDLSFEFWPPDGALLAVWERMRPGLAMRTFLESSTWGRQALEDGAAPPSASTTFSREDLSALQAGRRVEGHYDPLSWGTLIDAYVQLANDGDQLVRAVSGAQGTTVLTGGGLRSRRWRDAKVLLGRRPIDVSTVTEAATRGCAAIAGATLGWWRTAEDMPGTTRLPVATSVEMEEIAGALHWG